MKKGVIILGVILLVLLSSGCTGLLEPQIYTPPAPTTVAPKTTTAPITTTTAPPTQPPETVRTTNPQHYVLTLEEVNSDYLVTKSKYDNLEIILDEGTTIEDFNSLKDTGFIESHEVRFTDENDTIVVNNIVSRYESKSGVEKRLDFMREYYSKKENVPNVESVNVLVGREFGDGSVYGETIFKQSYLGTDVYYTSFSLNFAKENYKINIAIITQSDNVKLSDLYAYAEILENRITNDEHIVPPTTTSPSS